ncbi:hypothetical protein PENTCL1PPCAC_15737 [Pristionchus entomophagus]|uniref:glucuronosyltransferase n=1 Tax=Pristionchus entomophagus TaxID=358040 RepID=A0AAV5TEL0_9BILA|nr:hypothetical protein PENTCL1PPCAC_15737 [Pristionchus entomophagus]
MTKLFLAIFFLFQFTSCYKILVYSPKFGHSHSQFLGQIADSLVDAGHNVTVLLPIMNPAVADGTYKTHKIYVEPDPIVKQTYETHAEMNIIERNLFNPITPLFLGPMFGSNIGRTCEKMLAEPGLIERLRAEKYDVYIAENFEVCGIGISAAIQPKTVIGAASTCLYAWQFEEYGVPQALSYQPTLFYAHLNVHSIFSRLKNFIGELFIRTQFWFPRRACDAALKRRFGDEYPSVAEQSSRIAYLFTNSEPLIETAAPTLSRVIDISHIGAREPKPLDEKWSEILGRRPHSILVSFGSMVKIYLLPIETKLSILKMMSRFPNTTFIWKYERLDDEFSWEEASRVDNLVLTEWMPQIDILAHPSLSAFITHGGMGSVQEAAARGIPGIFIPIFGDQPRNAGMMERNGFGLVYDKFALADEQRLTATVREVVQNPKYRENARRISRMLAKKPFKAKEQLVRYVEFAAEFGPSPALRPQSHDMSFIAYHNLDIIAIFIVLSIVSISVFVKVTRSIIRNLIGIVKVKKE